MFVYGECCVLSGRGLCDGLITRPEESYRLWRVVVCDQETSKNEEAKARYQAVKIQPQWVVTPGKQTNKQTNKLFRKTRAYIAHLRQECHQHKIWHFWVTGIERNVCRCTFNRYSVITQFSKLAAGEQLCRRRTNRKLQHFKTSC
jgi:hypothetical protein